MTLNLKSITSRGLRLLAAVLFLVSSGSLRAADVKVSGVVFGDGEPLIGASIIQKDRPSNAAVTDIDGNFSLTVSDNAELTVSYVGYKTKTVKLNGRFRLEITLDPDATILDEVVAIGYGVQQKRLLTGATLQVKGAEIADKNTISAMGALQTQAPG